MFGLFKPKLPVAEHERLWVDQSFLRLGAMLGAQRMLEATVMLPIPQHFPDRWDGTEAALQSMFRRVAGIMQVDPDSVDVELFDTGHGTTNSLVPFSSGESSDAGGIYQHTTDRTRIGINESKMKNPIALVAVLAHELGHVVLLRPNLVDRNEEDMEPLNDLLTVYLGFGVFNANAAFQFHQYTNNQTQGWSIERLGYLSEEYFGYALARFAYERDESRPKWASHLENSVATYFKRSLAWFHATSPSKLFAQTIIAP